MWCPNCITGPDSFKATGLHDGDTARADARDIEIEVLTKDDKNDFACAYASADKHWQNIAFGITSGGWRRRNELMAKKGTIVMISSDFLTYGRFPRWSSLLLTNLCCLGFPPQKSRTEILTFLLLLV